MYCVHPFLKNQNLVFLLFLYHTVMPEMDAKHEYENIPVGDDHDGSRSSTEVESLMGEEKRWHAQELGLRRKRTKTSRVVSAFSAWRWVIDTLLLLAIVGLLVKDQLRQQPYTPWEIGGDFTGVRSKHCEQTRYEANARWFLTTR